jgi:hypothetical protein
MGAIDALYLSASGMNIAEGQRTQKQVSAVQCGGQGVGHNLRMPLSHMLRALVLVFSFGGLLPCAQAGERMDKIRGRGYLVCGVAPHDPGFSQRNADGSFQGFEIDLCRALAAALLGSDQQVRLQPLNTVHDYLVDADIDIVFHRLSWALTREAPGQLEFGPVYFFETAPDTNLEPLAPMLRSDDGEFSRAVRWAVYALVDAEMHGIHSANAQQIGVQKSWPPGDAGMSLGLDADWANRMVAKMGNYGEIFERNLGRASAFQQARGPNRLWRDGGLLITPLLK